jgi:hypothetical protein
MHLKFVFLLIIIATSNIIAGSENVGEFTSKTCRDDTFSYEQSTKGTGFFSNHQDIEKNDGFGVMVKNGHKIVSDPMNEYNSCSIPSSKGFYKSSMHGSGTIENENLLKYRDFSILKDERIHYGAVLVSSNNASTVISGNGDNQMVHSSETIPIGNGYYNLNPIKYDSQLGKASFAGIQNLISHEILYANSIDSEDQFVVNDTFENKYEGGLDGFAFFFDAKGVTNKKLTATMKFADDVDGAIQIHALNGNGMDIEEDYFGRYQLSRNVTFTAVENSTFSRPGFLTN